MPLTLIANSGIQLHKFDITIDPNQHVLNTMGFYEFIDQLNDSISLQYAYYLPNEGVWIPKKILRIHEYLDDDDRLSDNINYQQIKGFRLKEDKDYYTIGDIFSCLEQLASQGGDNKWLPVPYFKKVGSIRNVFGPIAWARMMIRPIPTLPNSPKGSRSYRIILSFDTKTATTQDQVYYAPTEQDTKDDDNTFTLCSNENLTLSFCDGGYNCEWVDRYLKGLNPGQRPPETFPRLRYLATYLYLIKYLEATHLFPEVRLYSDNQMPIDVDLVLDIGNANTCGLLFESPSQNQPFRFTSVKQLKLQDLSEPDKEYDNPFSMRLAFTETRFGDINIPAHKNFRWPSLLRLGPEAARLINSQNLDREKEMETATHHSSPKRYLWDNNKTDIPWEFINFRGRNIRDAIYYEGISEQFKENGDYAYDGQASSLPYYSRQSLMTFVYVEILLHAIAQVNSHEFRSMHGHLQRPRKIKRLTITCPTSIIQKEQVTLREAAVIAVRTLNRFFSASYMGKFDADAETQTDLEIIPRPKDLAKNLTQLDARQDWIYDEATCSQLVFLYAEVSKRYLNNAGLFFDLYGKKRDDATNTDKKALTIGSIDIGGGTTDLMICAYQRDEQPNLAVLTPQPLYWESFNLAGDDLLKNIVQQIVLEGGIASKQEEGCSGVIANSARQKGVPDVPDKMLRFFGQDSNKQGYMATIYRKNFIVQVAIPIAERFLAHTIAGLPDTEVGYEDLFPVNKPNKDLLAYFNSVFRPLRLEDIRWKLCAAKVSSIVETSFDPIIKQLSAILSAFGCDFVLLAGKPTSLPKIREMFIRYYSTSPDRIISLNQYRVGRWYPFADDKGYLEDPKTIVAVGALIALMGDKLDKLEGFKLKTRLLRQQLISTSDFIGLINQHTQYIDEIYLNPDSGTYEVEVFTLPIKLGYKQLANTSYRGKPIYKLEFNEKEIQRRLQENDPLLHNEQAIRREVEQFKNNLKNNMPFNVRIQRNIRESKEQVSIERVTDASRNERSRHLLSLSLMTLPDEYGYWLDTGEFVLNIK